jgi:hypothetical protein
MYVHPTQGFALGWYVYAFQAKDTFFINCIDGNAAGKVFPKNGHAK